MSTIQVNATLAGHSRIDFDKRLIRKVLRQQGGGIRTAARRLVATRAISAPGAMPGRDGGAYWRSIKVKVSSGGFWARIAPFKTNEMPIFYPAVLYYGSKRRSIEARANPMTDALEQRRTVAQAAIRSALQGALIPR
jgi:hypothetical protein